MINMDLGTSHKSRRKFVLPIQLETEQVLGQG